MGSTFRAPYVFDKDARPHWAISVMVAIRDNNPVVFTEHAGLYRTKGDVPTDPDFIVPIGVADVKRVGKDVTIVSYSRGTMLALAAAEQLAAEGIDAEVVDLRSLQPLDLDTVINSVKKTHRAVVVQEQWLFYGVAAFIEKESGAKIGMVSTGPQSP